MADKIIKQIDLATGEMLDGCVVYVPYRPKMRGGWFMAFQEAFLEIAKDREITGEIRRVLDYFFGKLDFENFIHLPQTEIAEALGLQKSHVSRAVKLLCDKRILIKGPKTGRVITYRLNPYYGWKGNVRSMSAARFQLIKGGKDDAPPKKAE